MSQLYFGKHKGEDIADVPIDYLRWLAANVRLSGKTREEVFARIGQQEPPQSPFMIAAHGNKALEKSLAGYLGYTHNYIKWGEFTSLEEACKWFEDRYGSRYPELKQDESKLYWVGRLTAYWQEHHGNEKPPSNKPEGERKLQTENQTINNTLERSV